MSTDKATVTQFRSDSVQAQYEKFNTALQHYQEYRAQLSEYQNHHQAMENMNSEDAQLFDAIGEAVGVASATLSTLSNFFYYGENTSPTKVETAPIAPPQKAQAIPTEEELTRLVRVRDKAFFDYMRSLDAEIPNETRAFAPDARKLCPADKLIKPYLKGSGVLHAEVEKIEKSIRVTLHRTWMDFIIESLFPSFVLKWLDYMSFKELVSAQKKAYLDIRHEYATYQQALDESFKDQWEQKYGVDTPLPLPCDLKQPNSLDLHKYVYAIDRDDLKDVHANYVTHATVTDLISFYRLAYQLYHQAQQTEEEVKAGNLENVLSQLEQLHPDMRAQLASEKSIAKKEMYLMDQFSSLRVADNETKRTWFLQELAQKYAKFLKSRTFEHYSDLYGAIQDHPEFRRDPLVQSTRKLLKEEYLDAYQCVREHYISHINEEDCIAFLNKYEQCNFNHMIYQQMIQFMRQPTLSTLIVLEQLMHDYQDTEYDYNQDPVFAKMIADFMNCCSSIALTTVADMRSELGSECSDETHSQGALSPSRSSSGRVFRADSVDNTSPSLTIEAMRNHNDGSENGYDPTIFGATARKAKCIFAGNQYQLVPST